MNIGSMIEYHRKKAGLSRIELARLTDVGKTLIYDLERGRETVSFDKLKSICDALNISLDFQSPFMKEFKEHDAR